MIDDVKRKIFLLRLKQLISLKKRLRTRTLRTCESNMPLEFKGSETNLTSPLISELSSGDHISEISTKKSRGPGFLKGGFFKQIDSSQITNSNSNKKPNKFEISDLQTNGGAHQEKRRHL